MNYWIDQGAPAHMLNLGIAFYGRVYTVDSTCSGVGAPVNSPGTQGIYTQMEGQLAYHEVKLEVVFQIQKCIPLFTSISITF